MQKNIKFIAPAAAAAVIVGYVGLGMYASSKAEQTIEDWVYDNGLTGQVRWESVSSSPFGGTITLKGVEVDSKNPLLGNIRLKVSRIEIADYENERERKRMKLELAGIDIPDVLKGPGAMLFKDLLHKSGRTELQAFDMGIKADYDLKNASLSLQYNARLPELLGVETSLELKNLPGEQTLLELAAAGANPFGGGNPMMGALSALAELETVELGKVSFSLRDMGYFERRSLIEQRYKYVLDPLKGDADKQRKAAREVELGNAQRDCQRELGGILPKHAENACKAWVAVSSGKGGGVKLAIAPERQVRVGDFSRLIGSPEQAGPMIERMNLKIDAL